MLQGFKAFIMRGNVMDLAVAVVIGAAFGAVITSLVNDVLNPVIAGVFQVPDLASFATWTINDGGTPEIDDDAIVSFGALLNAVINFLLVAAAIYFAVVLPLNKLAARSRKDEPVAEPEGPTQIALLTEIRDALKK
ncbi:large conductance mechanosensitive channel protein MscL [Demequina sp. TTPB684]|uniref:large conductance mechanosensitive channel protein MscL n=1 Tax=unclassified Demequina TaxID=2620311 RepID=UPI001CF2484E|nr:MULTISPECIES: large conductance mechanosensitive channel protein MscL [unclassified Demequina]MCB2413363.1 large conductance mechanosensitive channel protein MscL [Demequina sp. TTPB684]UPU87376.1 large conductance mechanosensitive channel protein MscL [Demequina sp. TMPB413]